MKVLPFTVPAAVVAAIIYVRLLGIIPSCKAAGDMSTITHGTDNHNTKDDKEMPKADHTKQEAHLIFPDAPALLGSDFNSHSTINRKLNSSCRDSPLKVLTGKARKSAKTCEFIKNRRKKLCKGRAIKSHCPNVCGVCESFGTADSEATFMYDGAKTDCAWLHGFLVPSTLWQISVLCKVDAIRETCRHTCGFFFHSCAMCSSEPTSRPSLEPSSIHRTPVPSESVTLSPSILPTSSPSISPSSPPSTLPSAGPSTSPSSPPSTLPTSLPSIAPSSPPSTLPSASPSTSPTSSPSSIPSMSISPPPSILPSLSPSTLPSASPTTCLDNIMSIINAMFGDLAKGPPQEQALTWLIEDISDDQCDNEAKIVQRYILAVFFFSAGGDDWYYDEGWLENDDECDWEGLTCDDNEQVTSLDIYFYYLNGNTNSTIPTELSSLTDLEIMILNDPSAGLEGTLPESFGDLTNLRQVEINSRNIGGTIPDMSRMVNLESVELSSDYTGSIVGKFDNLQKLRVLDLRFNNLDGRLDPKIFELPKLEFLYLNYNDLTGPIPDNFGGNTSLKRLLLYNNLLTGTIPEITGGGLQNIQRLDLYKNKMSGPVPDSICELRSNKPNQFRTLSADCAPPNNNAQNPCPSGCCTACHVGKGLP